MKGGELEHSGTVIQEGVPVKEDRDRFASFLTSFCLLVSITSHCFFLGSSFAAVYPSSSRELSPESFRVLQGLSIQVDCELEVPG